MNKLTTAITAALITGMMTAPVMAGTAKGRILDVQNSSSGILSFELSELSISGCSSVYTGIIDPDTGNGIYGRLIKLASYTSNNNVKQFVDFAVDAQIKVEFDIDCAVDGVYAGNSIEVGEIYDFFSPGTEWESPTTVYENSKIKVQLDNTVFFIKDKNTGEKIWTEDLTVNDQGIQQTKLTFASDGGLSLKARGFTFKFPKGLTWGKWQTLWEAGVSNSNSLMKFDDCGIQIMNTSNGNIRWNNDFNDDYSQYCN